MNRNMHCIVIHAGLAIVAGVLAYSLPQTTPLHHVGLRILLLWGLTVGFHHLGWGTLSRLAMSMTLTALVSPFFLNQNTHLRPLSLFNWAGLFLFLLMALNWLDIGSRMPRLMLNSTLVLTLFAGIPVLIFFQLNPLLEEVYAQPMLTSLANFIPIPLAFCIFLLSFNLRQSASVHFALGLPLLIPVVGSILQ